MSDKDSGDKQPWLVPVIVAVVGAVSTIAVAWINKPQPSPSPASTTSPSPTATVSIPPPLSSTSSGILPSQPLVSSTPRISSSSETAEGSTKSAGEDCDHHLRKDTPYRNLHTGWREVSGDITLIQTYPCKEGTCFSARMIFNTNQADDADGFWSGSRFELTRYISGENSSQIWSGTCLTNFVSGNWYYVDKERRSDRGQFRIDY
jgi:hypothetical protein